jgi:hypothetical protein
MFTICHPPDAIAPDHGPAVERPDTVYESSASSSISSETAAG